MSENKSKSGIRIACKQDIRTIDFAESVYRICEVPFDLLNGNNFDLMYDLPKSTGYSLMFSIETGRPGIEILSKDQHTVINVSIDELISIANELLRKFERLLDSDTVTVFVYTYYTGCDEPCIFLDDNSKREDWE